MPDGNPTGAQATPKMVEALTQTDEVVVTKDGIRTLTTEEQAGNSPAASAEGAPTETPVPGPEATPAPAAPTATPAPVAPVAPVVAPNTIASAQPSQAPVIDAPGKPVPVNPTQTAAPVAAPAPAAVAAPAVVAETAPLDQLATFVQETNAKAAATVEDARRVAQGQADRQTALVNKQLEAAKEATDQVRTKMHELEVRDLNPEERARAVTAFEQQDERVELDLLREQLTVTHRSVFLDSLVLEYSPFGLTRDTIESSSDQPEAMELWCEQQKSAFLQAKLDAPESAPITQVPTAPAAVTVAPTATVVAPSQVVAAVTPTPTPVAAAPAQPVPVAAANAPGAVPAGAESPSDIGATGAATEAWKPTEESGSEAMKDNIKHMAWEPIQLPK